MSGSPREKLKADIVRRQVEQCIREGKSISAAAKEVGCSYKHAKQIAEQMEASANG